MKYSSHQNAVADFSPHDFRRTSVGELLERSANNAIVVKLSTHESVKTTAGHDRRGETNKIKPPNRCPTRFSENLNEEQLSGRGQELVPGEEYTGKWVDRSMRRRRLYFARRSD